MNSFTRILFSATTAALLTSAALAADTKDGFTKIFNGKDLTGWSGNPQLWSVKDGEIIGQTTAEHPIKGNTFLIWTNGTTADFELKASFKIESNNDKGFANSGFQYRSKVLDEKDWVVGGYQADMEAGPNYTGILYDERGVAGGRGIMATRGEKVVWDKDGKKQVTGKLEDAGKIMASIQPGHWSEYRIVAQGNHLQHFINDLQSVDVTDECEAKRLTKGVLALQVHAGLPMTVRFKNIRIKTLSAEPSSTGDLKTLQGTWKVAGGEKDGMAFPPDSIPEITVTVNGSTYQVVSNDNTDKGSFTVDPAKSPKEMTVHPETGNDAGKTLLGIYELTEDTFKVCYGLERPTSFKTEQGDDRLVLSYKRAK